MRLNNVMSALLTSGLLIAFTGVMLLALRRCLTVFMDPEDWRFVGRTDSSTEFTRRMAFAGFISIPLMWIAVSIEIVRAVQRASF